MLGRKKGISMASNKCVITDVFVVSSDSPQFQLCFPPLLRSQRRKPAMNPHYMAENVAAGYQELSSLCFPGNTKKHSKSLSYCVGSSGGDSHHSSLGQSTELPLQLPVRYEEWSIEINQDFSDSNSSDKALCPEKIIEFCRRESFKREYRHVAVLDGVQHFNSYVTSHET